MTLNEIIERLEEYRDDLGGDCEVRLMTQQNWPFENAITGLASRAEIIASDEDSDDDEDDEADDGPMVYIVEGTQLGYGSKQAWEAAR